MKCRNLCELFDLSRFVKLKPTESVAIISEMGKRTILRGCGAKEHAD